MSIMASAHLLKEGIFFECGGTCGGDSLSIGVGSRGQSEFRGLGQGSGFRV